MRTIYGKDIFEKIKKAAWNFLFDQCGVEASEGRLKSAYQVYGLDIEDKDREGDSRPEIQAEFSDYQKWAKEKLSGSLFESCDDARRFFEEEWKPIILGGKACVMRRKRDVNSVLECYDKPNWKEMFNTKKVWQQGMKSAACWWMNNMDYVPTAFNPDPNYKATDKEYNLFEGFKYKAVSNGKSEKYMRLIKEGICRGNEQHYSYLLDWMAQTIQQPHRRDKVGIAVAIKGETGVGKTTFAKVFAELFGRTAYTVDNVDSITGQFNGALFEKILVVGEESIWGGDKKQYSILKRLITDDSVNISFKFKEVFPTKNYLRFIFLTNSDWSAPNEVGDRRLLVLCADDLFRKDTEFFGQLWEDMRNGGYEDLMFALLNRNMSERDFQKDFPITEWALENVERSLSPAALLVSRWLEYGISMDSLDKTNFMPFEWGQEIPKQLVYEEYYRFCRDSNKHPVPDSTLGKELKRIIPSLEIVRRDENGRKLSFYVLPSEEIAFREFESYKMGRNRRT